MRLRMERLNQARLARRGDKCSCPECTGRLHVYSTRVKEAEGVRVQYLECGVCKWKPDNVIRIPLEYAPKRVR